MSNLAKTIMIFLPNGDSKGIKKIDVTNRTIEAILIPRSKLKEAEARDEIKTVGTYLLIGEDETKAKPIAYIGEAEDCFKRIKQHNQQKEFWSHAVIIISKTNSFTKAHVRWLEYFYIKEALASERYILENNVTPNEPYITEQMKADLLDNFETIKTLLSTLNFPIFDRLPKVSKKDLFYCKGKLANATGELIDEGFLVLKDSVINKDVTKTIDSGTINLREKLLESNILLEKDETFIFTSNFIFKSPSTASSVVLGRRSNGWIEWKNKDSITLDKIKRKL